VPGILSKQKNFLENSFSPQTSLEFIGFIILGVSTNLVSNIFAEWDVVGLFGVSFLYIYWRFIEMRRAKKLPKDLTFSITPKAPEDAKGLILLLSPYSPRNPAIKNPKVLQPEVVNLVSTPLEKLQKADFEAIDLFNSNLVPQIKAVEHHMQNNKLRETWLITTKVKGSELSRIILELYLRFEYGEKICVHSQNLCIDDLDYRGLSVLGEKIFRESGYTNEVVVADITGGTKMMSVALAMSCINSGLKMQYMDSQRDWQGNPLKTGQIKAVGIDVLPIVAG
jgi:CRISPR-associated protein (Cas_Cas02710)